MITSAICVHRYLAEHAIDIVHTFDVPTNLLGVPISAASRTPVVISSQRAYRNLTPGIRHHLLRITDRMVDGIVVNARAIEQALITEDKVPPNRIHLCYNGIRTDVFFRRLPASLGPAMGRSLLVRSRCSVVRSPYIR